MSRSGYTDDYDEGINLYRGAVTKALQGKRGQKLLRELLAAMDAMEEKKLISDELINENGQCCALGVVAKVRGLDVRGLDEEDSEMIAKTFNIADAMAREVAFMNDEGGCYQETDEERFTRMRAWVVSQIRDETQV